MKGLEPLLNQVRPEMAVTCAVGLLAALAIGSCVSVVKPSVQEYQRLDQNRTSVIQQSEQQNAEEAKARIASLEQEIVQLREHLYGSASGIPPREVESHVIQSLDRISGRHAVELLSVTPGRSELEASFEQLPYDVRVTGEYFHLFEWLGDMESELRPMVVKEFQMSPQAATEKVELQLRLVAYRAAPEGS